MTSTDVGNRTFYLGVTVAKLQSRIEKLEKALKFVCDRKDLFFTECSVAEEIFDVCKQALEDK